MNDTDILTAFADYQRGKGLRPRTIENRQSLLASLARHTRRPLLEISTIDMRRHLGRGIKQTTMQTERDAYVALYRFLKDEGLRTDDPTERLASVRAPRGRPRPYTQEQIDALLASGAYKRTRAMILLACYQGLRRSEIAAVHGLHIDRDARTIRVPEGKGGTAETLPLHPTIHELAVDMPTDDWWFPARNGRDGHIHPGAVSDLMRRAKERAGISGDRLTGHSLRHSFGTSLVKGGADLRTVQRLMRHASLATTQIYTLIDDDQLRDGIEVLPLRTLPERSSRRAA